MSEAFQASILYIRAIGIMLMIDGIIVMLYVFEADVRLGQVVHTKLAQKQRTTKPKTIRYNRRHCRETNKQTDLYNYRKQEVEKKRDTETQTDSGGVVRVGVFKNRAKQIDWIAT